MEGLTRATPKYLVVVCRFVYESEGRTRYLPNDVRRYLMGLSQQYGKKRVRGLPEEVKDEFGFPALLPLYFALIKLPIATGEVLSNPARGAIAIYRIGTTNYDLFCKICKFIHERLMNKFKMDNIELIAGSEVRLGGRD